MEMTGYEWQRFVFRKAIKNGWEGKEPSVLGTHEADKAFKEADEFLTQKGILGERKQEN